MRHPQATLNVKCRHFLLYKVLKTADFSELKYISLGIYLNHVIVYQTLVPPKKVKREKITFKDRSRRVLLTF